MKKTLLIPFLILSVSAQAQFYLKAGAGEALTLAGQTTINGGDAFNGNITYNSATSDLSSYNVKSASLGKGGYFDLGLGVILNKNVGLELNGMMGVSMKKFTGTTAFPSGGSYVSEQYTMYAEHPVFINPALVIQTGGNFNLYARGGLLLPLSVKVRGDFDGSETQGLSSGRYAGTQEFKTYFSLGFSGATGFSFSIMKHVDIWAEANLNCLSLFVKERTYTKYTENGEDRLSDLSASTRDVSYHKSGDGSSEPTFSLPFSNISLNAGIRYRF